MNFTHQHFEEEFLGGPVIRINMQAAGGTEHDQSALEEILAAALREDPILVSCRVDAIDETCIQQLQTHGFRHVETLVTLERELDLSCEMAQGVEHELVRTRTS